MGWKVIDGFPDYEVTSCGRVRSWKKTGPGNYRAEHPKELRLVENQDGYYYVLLYNGSEKKQRLVHHLVLEAFVCKRRKGQICRHLDGNRKNNFYKNLKWGTEQENRADAIKHGTLKTGSIQPWTKLTHKKVKKIKKMVTQGFSSKELAEKFNTTKSNIDKIRQNITWKET